MEKPIFIWKTPGTGLWPEYHVIKHPFFWETPGETTYSPPIPLVLVGTERPLS